MTKFVEGQDVEVHRAIGTGPDLRVWEMAKIVDVHDGGTFETYVVGFQNGVQVAFDSKYIRAVEAYDDIEFLDRHYDEYGWNERQARK